MWIPDSTRPWPCPWRSYLSTCLWPTLDAPMGSLRRGSTHPTQDTALFYFQKKEENKSPVHEKAWLGLNLREGAKGSRHPKEDGVVIILLEPVMGQQAALCKSTMNGVVISGSRLVSAHPVTYSLFSPNITEITEWASTLGHGFFVLPARKISVCDRAEPPSWSPSSSTSNSSRCVSKPCFVSTAGTTCVVEARGESTRENAKTNAERPNPNLVNRGD